MEDATRHAGGACPHVDDNDTRCGHRFSLSRVEQAFDVCFGGYHACPMYHRLNAEHRRRERAAVPLIEVTISGHTPMLRPAPAANRTDGHRHVHGIRATGS